MPAVCEIEIGTGICGVQAIGRCATCGKAFCATHQARVLPPRLSGSKWEEGTPFTDMCAPCYLKSPGYQAALKEEADRQAIYKAHDYFKTGAPHKDLLAAGVQPITFFKSELQKTASKGRFGRISYDTQWVNVPFRRGWILGTFSWHASTYKQFLTALLDEEASLWIPGEDNCGLYRVEPCPEGYKVSLDADTSGNYAQGWTFSSFDWQEALEAVKRLTKLP